MFVRIILICDLIFGRKIYFRRKKNWSKNSAEKKNLKNLILDRKHDFCLNIKQQNFLDEKLRPEKNVASGLILILI